MSKPAKVSWGGYEFNVYDPAVTNWNDVPGVYIFAGLDNAKLWWYAKYIGQTISFQNRISSHERWSEAAGLGATHVHARVVHDASQRIALEDALIRAYQPPLNDTPR